MSKPKVFSALVTGSSGHQGGAVARQLLAHHHHVKAFTRKPNSPNIIELEKLGAQIMIGEYEDPKSLLHAMKGVNAVFAMATMMEKGVENEIQNGIALVDAAKTAKVPHFIYSSVASANRNTGIPHFDSKYQIEQYIH